MTKANTFSAKLFVGFVVTAMLFTLSFSPAKAATTEELQAQINALLAQIAALQGGSSTGGSSSCTTFTMDQTMGSKGAEVTALQNFLIGKGHAIAAGATGFFGAQTKAALMAYQTAAGISPAAGYFGPITRAKVNADCTPSNNGGNDDDSDDDSSTGDLSGEASLDEFEIDSADDETLEEGAEDAEVARGTFTFQDGDAKITRIDVVLDSEDTTTDVWDVLSDVSLWVDGKEVAREDASDEDNYLDTTGNKGTIRFSGLDIVAMEDEDMEVTVGASIQNSVDSDDMGTYSVAFNNVRYIDGDDVTTTDSETGDLDTPTEVTFDIEAAGADDELIVKTSDADPDGGSIQLKDDERSGWETLFAFDLDTDDSVNDIELTTIPVTINLSSSTYNNIVDDVQLVIDGKTIDASASDVTNGGTNSARIDFDVDGDVTIDAGDRVTAELQVRFKSLALGNEGMTASGTVTSANADAIEAEGGDDLTTDQISGSAVGEDHTLRTTGIDVEANSVNSSVTVNDGSRDDYGTYTIKFDVTAFEQDVYISTNPATSINYVLEDGAGSSSVTGTRSVTLTSTADEQGSSFEVTEGSTETFTLKVTYTPATANTASRLQLNSVTFGSSAGTPTGSTWTATPDEDYRTDVETIVD